MGRGATSAMSADHRMDSRLKAITWRSERGRGVDEEACARHCWTQAAQAPTAPGLTALAQPKPLRHPSRRSEHATSSSQRRTTSTPPERHFPGERLGSLTTARWPLDRIPVPMVRRPSSDTGSDAIPAGSRARSPSPGSIRSSSGPLPCLRPGAWTQRALSGRIVFERRRRRSRVLSRRGRWHRHRKQLRRFVDSPRGIGAGSISPPGTAGASARLPSTSR